VFNKSLAGCWRIFVVITIFLLGFRLRNSPDNQFCQDDSLEHLYFRTWSNTGRPGRLGQLDPYRVSIKEWYIFSSDTWKPLTRVNDEVFFLPGVNALRNSRSLWTPNVRWTEVTEQGFDGGPVPVSGLIWSTDQIEDLRV